MSFFDKLDIEKLKEKNDIYGLIEVFSYSSEKDLQEEAKKALISIGEPAIKPLIWALADENGWVKTYSSNTLIEIGAPAVDLLIVALQGSNIEIRRQTASVLGGIKDKRAIEPLTQALFEEDDEFLRACAARALGEIQDKDAIEYLKKAAAEDKTKHVREEAINSLKKFNIQFSQVASPDDKIMTKIDTEESGEIPEELIPSEKGEEQQTRNKTWEEENDHFVKEVSRMLEKIEEEQELDLSEKLSGLTKEKQMAEDEKSYIKIGSALKEPFIEAIEGGDEYVMKEVSDMIQSLDRNNTIILEDKLSEEEAFKAPKEEPKKISGDTSSVEAMVRKMTDEDKEVRKRAILGLEKVRDPRAVDALIKALEDTDREIQISAAIALGEQKDLQAIEPLVELYFKVNDSDYYNIPIKYKGRNIWTICEAFKKKQYEVEKAIKKIGGPEALQFIAKYKPQNKIEAYENAKIWWYRTGKSQASCAWCKVTIRSGCGYLVESKKQKHSEEDDDELLKIIEDKPELICENCYNNNLDAVPYRKENI
ncbi:MAG: HEAT repeat domain-containing protein [Candidatus Aminicenantes bacterium]|nr:HEAT repeat domain-containing protein [Candidatus Aminicenantes bacterium]